MPTALNRGGDAASQGLHLKIQKAVPQALELCHSEHLTSALTEARLHRTATLAPPQCSAMQFSPFSGLLASEPRSSSLLEQNFKSGLNRKLEESFRISEEVEKRCREVLQREDDQRGSSCERPCKQDLGNCFDGQTAASGSTSKRNRFLCPNHLCSCFYAGEQATLTF